LAFFVIGGERSADFPFAAFEEGAPMEGITRLVSESLLRHGFEPISRHRSMRWTPWIPCESPFRLALFPSEAGIYALAEELVAENPATGGKRLLALLDLVEAKDLGLALGKLCSPHSQFRLRLANRRCFIRYAVIEDPDQRRSALSVLRNWVSSFAQTAVSLTVDAKSPQVARDFASIEQVADAVTLISNPGSAGTLSSFPQPGIGSPTSLPSGF
jgi:hypothetical protein